MIDIDAIIDEAMESYPDGDAEGVTFAVMETVRRTMAACRAQAAEADGNSNHVAAAAYRFVANSLEHDL